MGSWGRDVQAGLTELEHVSVSWEGMLPQE